MIGRAPFLALLFSLFSFESWLCGASDPVLTYSSYLGGSLGAQAVGVGLDGSGNVYVTGITVSADFPVKNAPSDPLRDVHIFVTKLSPDGSTILYSRLIGGSGSDQVRAMSVDRAGNVYLTGRTNSRDFPVTNAAQALYRTLDAFALKLDPAGAVVFATYLGGTGIDVGTGIAADRNGAVYVAGETQSRDFPTVKGLQAVFGGGTYDAFLIKIGAEGGPFLYSTLIGGAGSDRAQSVAVDTVGSIYVTGFTDSVDFPLANALQSTPGGGEDAFVVKLDAAGSRLLYATYLGGSGFDEATAIAVDAAGSAYVAGATGSADYPMANPLQSRPKTDSVMTAFLSKLSPGGTSLVYSTYLGGSGDMTANAMAVDSAGQVVIAGRTQSGDLAVAGFAPKSIGCGLVFRSLDGGKQWKAANAGLMNRSVLAFAVDPSSPSRLFAGMLGGGLFVSTDAGASWRVSGTVATTPSVSSFAFDPRNPATVYAAGFGIDRSRDSGRTWAAANGSLPTQYFSALASTPGSLYAGGERGIFKSTDGADLWASASIGLPTSTSVYALAADPSASSTLYAGTSRGVYKSTDGGGSWTVSTTGIGTAAVYALAVDPSHPATLYAGSRDGVFKSTSSGANWTLSAQTQGGYVISLAVDPKDPSAIYAGSYLGGVGRSSDGAASWEALQSGPKARVYALAVDPSVPATVYAATAAVSDAYVAKIDASGSRLLYASFLGGVEDERADGVALDASGNAWVCGSTQSADFPLVSPLQSEPTGALNAFLAKLSDSPAATQAPRITAAGVANSASYSAGVVAPGQIVTIFGSGIGPDEITRLRLNAAGGVDTELAGTRVLFDGIAAPLIYVAASQVSAVVPYSVAAKSSTALGVEFNGARSNVVTLPVVPSQPGIFTVDGTGLGQASMTNQDGSFNSSAAPAAKGTVVVFYLTGEGQTAPAGEDGKVATPPLAAPVLPVSALVDGTTAEVLYAGGAPGMIAGVMQVNVRVPDGSSSGNSVPLLVKVGSASSRAGGTLAVR